MRDVLRRAMEAAQNPSGEDEPWRFYHLSPEVIPAVVWLYARLMEEEVGPEGARAAYEQWRAVPGWVVVTCRRIDDAEERERAVEDCLTAVQRYSLSLWSDNVPTNWVTEAISESDELYDLAEIDAETERVLGVVLYGHPERG